ncbi:DUF6603 domain-containing protein [Micromonospora sp. LZ34]
MNGDSTGTIEQLAAELALVFEPLARRAEDGTTDLLLEWVGLRASDASAGSAALAAALGTGAAAAGSMPIAVRDLVRAIEDDDSSAIAAAVAALLQHFATLVQAIRDAADALQSLSIDPALTAQQQAEVAAFAGEFVERLLGRLFVEYLEERFPQIALVLIATGVVEIVPQPGGPAGSLNAQYLRKTLRFDRLARLFTDPVGLLRDVYAWGQPGFDGLALFTTLQTLLREKFEIPAEILQPPGDPALLEAFGFTAEVDPTLSPPGLTFSIRLPAGLTRTDTITAQDWDVTFETAATFAADIEGTLRPLFDVQVDAASGTVDVTARANFARSRSAPPFLLLGAAGGSRLEIQSPTAGIGLDLHFDTTTGRVTVDPEFSIGLRGGKLVISGAGGDGFIAKLLAGVRLESAFDTGMTWSLSKGAQFTGSAALEIAIPAHVTLGPLEILSLYLRAALAADGTVPIELSGGFKAALGPLTASVDRLGLTATISFPPAGGKLGPADVAFAFKPPNGVGLAIDAGVVKGGGFLYLDFEKGEYAGALELTVSNFLSLKAIGLVNTKLPGNQPGFSLLVIITAEFSPGFQLGYGFTLIGVGGLLGLNRAMLLDPLVQGVRTGAVNSILFPTNVIANAPKIISDLRAIFPPKENTFLIGPMAKIGWGTPTLISVALGVIIEIPGNVVILGRLGATLPTEDDPVLVLQVSFVGALEFDKRRLWFFATLYGSRVLFITLQGEMGLLMDFSDQPNFVLSVGGFHPRFTAPPLPFPSPARIALSLVNEDYARVGAQLYFAITSNSVQIGCRADAFFGFDSFSVEGYVSFDALLRFSPFYLIVEISAGFSVKVFGVGLFGVHLRASLEGPTPWHIKGSAEISILFFSFDVDVDVTFGERRAETLPPIEVLPQLRAEFEKLESWQATLPAAGQLFVSLRELGTAGALVLHPVGTLRISQRFVPLNLPLDKIGNQRPSDIRRASVSVQTNGLAVKGTTREKFAAAQYRDMDDAAKLSAPAYEPLDSGVEVGAAGQPWTTGPLAQRTVRYETIIVDTALERVRSRFVRFWDALFVHFRAGASVSRAGVSKHAEQRLQPFANKITIADDRFAVAFQADNRAYKEAATFASFAEAQAHLAQATRADPALAEQVHVIPMAEVNPR